MVAQGEDEQVAGDTEEVIGGSVAAVGAWPFQATIRVPGFSHYCGGTLIGRDWILTAAHCVDEHTASQFTVTMGEHDLSSSDGMEQTRAVSVKIPHPNYASGSSSGNYDVALLRVSSPFTLNERVRMIRPAIGQDGAGQNSIISGWGYTSPGSGSSTLLMQATLPIATNASCDAAPNLSRNLFADELCAGFLNGQSGGCHGDSGGPLSVQRHANHRDQVGIVSWGQGNQCATYTVFARVSTHAKWIRDSVLDVATLPIVSLPL